MAKYAVKAIKQKKFHDARQEALIRTMMAGIRIRKVMEETCEAHGITLPQFNILRILKGVHPGAHPRSEISKRMIDNSDVTRLIDRLEKTGLVKRTGGAEDKRQSLTMITPKGLSLLKKLDLPFQEAHEKLIAAFTDEELETLVELLKRF
jgi:DNA-binding MarR family transcriptional regulator